MCVCIYHIKCIITCEIVIDKKNRMLSMIKNSRTHEAHHTQQCLVLIYLSPCTDIQRT